MSQAWGLSGPSHMIVQELGTSRYNSFFPSSSIRGVNIPVPFKTFAIDPRDEWTLESTIIVFWASIKMKESTGSSEFNYPGLILTEEKLSFL